MSARTPLALVGLGALIIPLLRRMRSELESSGTLSRPTVAVMYAAYAVHAALVARTAYQRTLPVAGHSSIATASGAAVALAGAALCVAGMKRFTGPGQLSGTEVGGLTTGGVYRYSRNPQYLGYVLALTGIGLARKSTAVIALAACVGIAFRYWVGVEERHLDRAFGSGYRRYREGTPRWLGSKNRRREVLDDLLGDHLRRRCV